MTGLLMAEPRGRVLALHLGLIAVLFAAQFVLGEYHHTNVARIMVLAAYAVGYNLLLGYTGLMSLGHAMFFAAGMYGAGLAIYHLGFGAVAGFGLGVLAACFLASLGIVRSPLGRVLVAPRERGAHPPARLRHVGLQMVGVRGYHLPVPSLNVSLGHPFECGCGSAASLRWIPAVEVETARRTEE